MTKEIKVTAPEKTRIDIYMRDNSGVSRGEAKKYIDNNNVRVNGKPVKAASHQVKDGDIIEFTEELPPGFHPKQADIPIDIIHLDDDILVINKQPGLVVHPAAGHIDDTLVNAIAGKYINPEDFRTAGNRFGIVHRLDKDTSGVMVIARTAAACRRLVLDFKERKVSKTYTTLVHGVVEKAGSLHTYIERDSRDRKKFAAKMLHGKEAQTLYEPKENFNTTTFLKVKILTGRTHQIRVHMSYMKNPVVGDTMYGDKNRDGDLAEYLGYPRAVAAKLMPRQMLHATVLELSHPVSGKALKFEAPIPEDMLKLIKMLRKKAGKQ
ncbi:MAG: RluA family pseudouridine synthase [Spirochaetia bacterium]|nr:RluA family pseudouridine synthase [Spirochaetia bacterium]